MDYQQVNERYLNDWYGKNEPWKERNSELCIANELTLMFHQLEKSIKWNISNLECPESSLSCSQAFEI